MSVKSIFRQVFAAAGEPLGLKAKLQGAAADPQLPTGFLIS